MSVLPRFLCLLQIAFVALVLSACNSESQTSENSASVFKLPTVLADLTESRMIDRDALFAEIILRYENVEETAIAARMPDSDNWQADFRLPGGVDYSLELTWFDTVDGGRLDLVNFRRSFRALFESGPITFDFSDYDFDGYDADNDGFVNLAEREAGTSPLIAADTNNAVQICQGGVILPADTICSEDATPVIELGFTQSPLNAAMSGEASSDVVISNTGTASLSYNIVSNQSWIQINGDVDGSGVSGTVVPNESISLGFQASCAGSIAERNGTLTVERNDVFDILPVTLVCSTPGADDNLPALQVSPVQFAEVLQINSASSQQLVVENAGSATLTYDISSSDSWLAVSGGTGSLEAGQSESIEVQYSCDASIENRNGQLAVNWNLGSQPVPFSLSCMGPLNTEMAGSIAGTVRDAVNDAPLQGVQAELTLDSNTLALANTDVNGDFQFNGVPAQQGYAIAFTLTGYVAENYAAIETTEGNTTFLQTILKIDEQFAGTGAVGGTVVDAVTGLGVEGLSLSFRRGINTEIGSVVNSATTDNNGQYALTEIPAGNYTVEINGNSYQTAYFTVIALGGQENNNQNASVSPLILSGETRIVLTWGETPSDLDSHLTGPIEGSADRFHVYFGQPGSEAASPFVFLDVDDTSSFGPETITINQQTAGNYRYSVHDFSNAFSTGTSALAQSTARVQVFRNNGLIVDFNVPNEPGTLWTVFELAGNEIIPINTMSFESNSGNDAAFKQNRNDAALISHIPAK